MQAVLLRACGVFACSGGKMQAGTHGRMSDFLRILHKNNPEISRKYSRKYISFGKTADILFKNLIK